MDNDYDQKLSDYWLIRTMQLGRQLTLEELDECKKQLKKELRLEALKELTAESERLGLYEGKEDE